MFPSTLLQFTVLALVAGSRAAVSNLQAPENIVSGQTVTVTWDSDQSDPAPLILALYSTAPTYSGAFALVNDINPGDHKATVVLPDVPPSGGYSFALLSAADPTKFVTSSGVFPIGAAPPPPAHSSAVASGAHASSAAHQSVPATASKHSYTTMSMVQTSATSIETSVSETTVAVSSSTPVASGAPLTIIASGSKLPAPSMSAKPSAHSGSSSAAAAAAGTTIKLSAVLGGLVAGAALLL
ncbi:hypothetical protein MKEN_01360200 [Mycena kentingensis (nom. inval.)]|nr:hypothetical protein MKEN_01360200 [Mycena kentingensis (nom. inval.)]